MANTRFSNAAAIAALDSLLAELNTGGAGTIEIRTGAPPATCETADSGTLLSTLTLNATAFAGATDGTDKATAAANAITADTSAAATGTAAHFRGKSGGGTVVIQGDITVTAGGGDIEMDSVEIQTSDKVSISAWTVNLPET
jgi:hypothetical protein